MAHKKVVSRVLSKSFASTMKVSALSYLRDVGYFQNRFDQEVMQADVLPWLYERTDKNLTVLEGESGYTTSLIGNYVAENCTAHSKAVQAYADMIKARRAAEKQAEEDKIAAKLRRKQEREAKRKAAEIAKLREEIKEKYVDKAQPVDEILKQEITDIDGWSQDGKPVVSAIGGWLGQLMIVLNTVAKFYPQLDRPVRTGRSGSRPKSRASGKSSGAKSQKSEGGKSEG